MAQACAWNLPGWGELCAIRSVHPIQVRHPALAPAQLHMGRPGPLSKPIDRYLVGLNDVRRRDLAQTLECSAIGEKEAVGEWLTDFIKQTGADEVMIDCRIYDPVARCRSYQYAAEAIS